MDLAMQYPLSAALGLKSVPDAQGFDMLELESHLGTKRFQKLRSALKRDFVCGHRNYPSGEFAGTEVHCAYAQDVEAFLKAGG